MSKTRILVILLGIAVVIAQVVEFSANGVLSDWEKKKDDIYTDYERYIDFTIEALTVRGAYNTLQAINNTNMFETMIDREKEVLDLLLTSLMALTNHIQIENKDEWEHMNYTELMDIARELSPTIQDVYGKIIIEVNNWKQNVNIISATKFILLASEDILVNFDKDKKR